MEGKITINGNDYQLTKHALHRANRRNITLEEIIDAIERPKKRYTTKAKGKEDSICIEGKNRVRVILNLTQTVIITVLRVNKQYAKSKHKAAKNKKILDLKRLYGNRVKK